MKRIQYTETDIINWWMVPIHGLTISEAFKKEPWENSNEFYERYAVTQEQHDEWYEKTIAIFMKHYRWSKKRTVKEFVFVYLNTSPMIKKIEKT